MPPQSRKVGKLHPFASLFVMVVGGYGQNKGGILIELRPARLLLIEHNHKQKLNYLNLHLLNRSHKILNLSLIHLQQNNKK